MMNRPKNMYRKGGLKDEGGEIDPVSGNEVPVGGTKKGVRDDIPVNLSEGEFVMPEDATRYHGLKTLMQLRQEAKMGLKQMEAMGLMGNGDEAVLPDDLPFGMDDLIVVEVADKAKDMNVGGVTTRTEAGITGGGVQVTRPEQPVTRPDTSAVAPEGEQTQFRSLTGTAIPTRLSIPEFKEYMGEAYLEFKEYRNAEGKSMLIPFIGGKPLYDIPDGYTLYDPDPVGDGTGGGGGTGGGTGGGEGVDDGAVDPLLEQQTSASDKESVKDKHGYETKASEPINWNGLSDQELLDEAGRRMGFGRTLAEGIAFGINPAAGLGVKTLLAIEDRKVLEELKRRAAAGSTMFDEMIKTYEDKNKGILNGAIGKVVDLYNNTFGKTEEEKAATAKAAASVGIPVETGDTPETTATTTPTVTQVTPSQQIQDAVKAEDMTYDAFGNVIAREPAQTTLESMEAPYTPSVTAPSSTQDNTITGFEVQDPRSQGATTPEEVVMQQPVVSTAQQTKTEADKEQIVMDQEVKPATVAPTVEEQTTQAFQPTVTTTTGTGTGRDFADMPVTPEQQTYASAAQEREDPFDPRNITRVPSEQTTNIPVTTTAQIDTPTLSQPAGTPDDSTPDVGLSTTVGDPFIVSGRGPAPITPTAEDVPTGMAQPQTYTDTSSLEGVMAASGTPKGFDTQTVQEVMAAQQDAYEEAAGISQPVETKPTVTQVTPSQEIQDAVTAADITYDAFGDVIQKEETFDEAFARNRKLGAATFEFGGETYTTETAEEAAAKTQVSKVEPVSKGKYNPADSALAGPATTNTLSAAEQKAFDAAVDTGNTAVVDHYVSVNRLRDKQDKYAESGFDPAVGAGLGLSKNDMEQAEKYGGSVQTAINEGRAESQGPLKPVKVTDSSKSKNDDSPAPVTNAQKNKDNNIASTGRNETTIQKEINQKISDATDENGNVDWVKADVGNLVEERDSARANEGSSGGGGNDDGGGGSGGDDSTYCCTASFKRRQMSITEVKELRKWHNQQSEVWREGYDIWGKWVADNLVAKSDWSASVVKDIHRAFVKKDYTLKGLFGILVITSGVYPTGLYKVISKRFFKKQISEVQG